ncbi:HIT-like domain-containing protein [Scleroderma yunnanense]
MSLDIHQFQFERILDENPYFRMMNVLGTLPAPSPDQSSQSSTSNCANPPPRLPAILRLERTPFPLTFPPAIASGILDETKLLGRSDIYSWMNAWISRREEFPDLKINVICPATDVHVRKYSRQDILMVHETPELYEAVVKPYIEAFPPSRTQWVQNILDGTSEAGSVLHTSPSFLILPDMKWDATASPVTALYLIAIVRDSSIRSMRDLWGAGEDGDGGHVPLLKAIRDAAHTVVERAYGLKRGNVRLYVHYQPSYYHFHVHIVHASQSGIMGMTVGQAHLLDDIISMLTVSPNIMSSLTFTYGLGSQHGLYEPMLAAQANLE